MAEASPDPPRRSAADAPRWLEFVPLVAVTTMIVVDLVALVFVARVPIATLALLPITLAALGASPLGSRREDPS